jgi:hypothetical protein
MKMALLGVLPKTLPSCFPRSWVSPGSNGRGRPPDLVSVQGIERMAAPGGLVTVSGSRDAVILVSCVLSRYHWRSLPQSGAASTGGSGQLYHDVSGLRVVAVAHRKDPGRFHPGFRRPKDLSLDPPVK